MRVNNDFLDMSIPVRSVGPYFYSVVDLGPGVASLCDVNFEQVSNYEITEATNKLVPNSHTVTTYSVS